MSYSSKFGGRAGKEKKSAPKPSAKKVKCLLCQQKGHDATKCPKNKEQHLTPLPTTSGGGGAGSGIAHKTSRKASSNNNKEQDDDNDNNILPPNNDNPYFVFDAGCDVGASMDGLAILFKVPEKKCISTYNTAVCSTTPLIYGGAICRQYIKANKPIWKKNAPRVNMMMEADPRLFFVIGLGHGFCEGGDDDDDDDDAMDALADALDDDDRVVGFCAKLDYAPDMIARTNVATQIRRLKTTCDIAMQEGVPIQIQVGSTNSESSSSSSSDESSGQILKDLATVLLDVIPQDDETPLQVHLSSWSGTSDTMLKLLKAFPDTLYIGMNPTVGFGKAATAHACAFDIPLDRLLLETDNIIPAPISKSLGRKAFAHSGLVPHCAVAVADQKKIPPEDVARAASENTVRLYGRGIGRRAKEAVVEAAARVAQQQKQILLAEEQEEEEAANNNKEQVETKQDQKKKKKKKQGGAAEAKQQDAGRDLDDDILSSMLQESEIVP